MRFHFLLRPFPVSAPLEGSVFCWKTAPAKDPEFLNKNLRQFMAAARKRPELAGVTTTALPTIPQVYVDVDRPQGDRAGSAAL